MFTSIAITSVLVLDQDEALDFYVGKLGFAVHDDVDMGFMRWLTIALPSEPQRQLLLEVPGAAALAPRRPPRRSGPADQGRAGRRLHPEHRGLPGTYEALRAKGVEFTEEPHQQPYGVDCALRDPFGNHIRITQPKQGPVEITQADKDRWGGSTV